MTHSAIEIARASFPVDLSPEKYQTRMYVLGQYSGLPTWVGRMHSSRNRRSFRLFARLLMMLYGLPQLETYAMRYAVITGRPDLYYHILKNIENGRKQIPGNYKVASITDIDTHEVKYYFYRPCGWICLVYSTVTGTNNYEVASSTDTDASINSGKYQFYRLWVFTYFVQYTLPGISSH